MPISGSAWCRGRVECASCFDVYEIAGQLADLRRRVADLTRMERLWRRSSNPVRAAAAFRHVR